MVKTQLWGRRKAQNTTAFSVQTWLCYLAPVTCFFTCACSPAAVEVLHINGCFYVLHT
jgi:hypothetical protein